LVEHAPPELVGWVRFQVGPLGSLEKNCTCVLSSLTRSVDGWVQRERLTRGAAIDSSPATQHSLQKQPRGPRSKQAEMGAASHSWHSARSTESEYSLNEIQQFGIVSRVILHLCPKQNCCV